MPRSLAVAAALILAGYPVPGLAQAPPAPPVSVAKPIAKRIATWDEYSGHFEAVETVEVRPRVSGFVDKVHFKDGQLIKAGDPLFTIDQRPFELAEQSAEAEVARTKANVAFQKTEVERAAPLVSSGAVTERDFTQRSANLLIAQAQQQAAEAALKQAQLNLEWSVVTAPISGRISNRKVDVGNLVTAPTTLLTTIVSLDPIHFVFDASEADYLRYARLNESGVRPSSRDTGNPVRVRLADEETFQHEGMMNFVDNQMNARSGTIRGRAVLENKAQLFVPGVFARLQLFGGDVDALLIPDNAVVSDQMRKIVFTVGEDNVIAAKTIKLGPIHEGLRVVQSGLTKDDNVVIDGIANPMVRPGAKVTPEPGEIKAQTAAAN
jgi:RND family efflux transporter MFP subunit